MRPMFWIVGAVLATVSVSSAAPPSAASLGRELMAVWEMTGVQNQPIPGRIEVATGNSFSVRGVTLVEVEGDLIRKATDYMDLLGFVVQLGARIELPGGVVIGSE